MNFMYFVGEQSVEDFPADGLPGGGRGLLPAVQEFRGRPESFHTQRNHRGKHRNSQTRGKRNGNTFGARYLSFSESSCLITESKQLSV